MNLRKLWLGILVVSLTSCTSSNVSRDPAAEKPTGLHGYDEATFNHIGEGSEIYPYEWLVALKTESGGPFLKGLDKRHNLIRDTRPEPYLMPWVGMTAAWSDHNPVGSDALKTESGIRLKVINGKKSIKLVGVNCAACHTNQIQYNQKAFRIDGAPAMLNIRGFFKDMAKSTIGLFLDREKMEAFLVAQNVPNAKKRADELCAYFTKRFGEDTGWFEKGSVRKGIKNAFYFVAGSWLDEGKLGTMATLAHAKYGDSARLHKGKKAIEDSLVKLLRVTYGFKEHEDLGELKYRMKFLGLLFSGKDPKMEETIAGFARTDAFGRIGNLVLRGDHPVDNTGPVSYPWIWGLKYKAQLHYNGNTNSVVARNVGQSLGLGSVITNLETGDSTTNMYNLDRLEKLAYKIGVPEWDRVFAAEPKLHITDVQRSTALGLGKQVYERECKSCHTTNKKVGPANALYEYKMYPLDSFGTDKNHATLITTPINGEAFHTAIFSATLRVKSRYYEKYKIPEATQANWESRDTRGEEYFRDTYLVNKAGYRALHLAGVWATAPYLHNGSVPNMTELLKRASDRPRTFHVRTRVFDPVNLGFVMKGNNEKCDDDDETCFDTTLPGNHNGGHEYGVNLDDASKRALIDYLKILPPEPEYAW